MSSQNSSHLRGAQLLFAQFGVVAIVGVGLALAGAFGTDALPLPARLLYWIGGLWVAGLILQILAIPMRSVCRLAGIDDTWSYLLALPLLGAIFLIAFAAAGLSSPTQGPTMFWQTVALGASIFVLFAALHWMGMRHSPSPVTGTRDGAALRYRELPNDTALHAKLPVGFGPILAATVEDHYVQVIGSERRAMLLMNLSDAIAQLGPESGLQVHRSWWVAKGAMAGLAMDGRNLRVILNDGTRIPVSRSKVAAVKALAPT